MNILHAALLGLVQGLTEFLPVSSTGHLILAQYLMGFKEPMLAFDIIVHLGTLMAVCLYYGKDLRSIASDVGNFLWNFFVKKDRRYLASEFPGAVTAGLVIAASIPTALIGFAFQDSFERMFGSLTGVGVIWILFGILLVLSGKFQDGTRGLYEMNQRDAFWIGLAQAVSIIPSISRSGATILTAMLLGIERRDAAKFSLLISIPAVAGAALLKLKDGMDLLEASPHALAAGFVASAASGYITIIFLVRFLKQGSFPRFGFYCVAAGIVSLLVGFFL